MISRVAESCFWMARYLERASSIARLMRVNRAFALDAGLRDLDQWTPIIVVAGEREAFDVALGAAAAADGEKVQDYLTWDERSPVSVISSIKWARENARTIREVISLEMWEIINGFWVWLNDPKSRKLYNRDRDTFYTRCRDVGALLLGTAHNTLLHEEPFDFMLLGMHLERAGQTARVLDVNHHMFGPDQPGRVEMPMEAAQWLAILRSCSASEPFFKRHRGTPRGKAIAGFLLKDEMLPRSVMHCLDRATSDLQRINEWNGRKNSGQTGKRLAQLAGSLRAASMDDLFARGFHEELTHAIEAITEICGTVHTEYFDPRLSGAKAA